MLVRILARMPDFLQSRYPAIEDHRGRRLFDNLAIHRVVLGRPDVCVFITSRVFLVCDPGSWLYL